MLLRFGITIDLRNIYIFICMSVLCICIFFVPRFVLAVDEVTANIIEHGVDDEDCWIEIRVDEKDKKVVVQIIDSGRPFDPTLVDDFDPRSVTRRKRGFGIHLIKLIACKIEYCRTSDSKNCLTLTLPIT